MLVYYIEISIGEWEDVFTFTYKELYFTSLEKAEKIKTVLDTINLVWTDIVLNDGCLSPFLSWMKGLNTVITIYLLFLYLKNTSPLFNYA